MQQHAKNYDLLIWDMCSLACGQMDTWTTTIMQCICFYANSIFRLCTECHSLALLMASPEFRNRSATQNKKLYKWQPQSPTHNIIFYNSRLTKERRTFLCVLSTNLKFFLRWKIATVVFHTNFIPIFQSFILGIFLIHFLRLQLSSEYLRNITSFIFTWDNIFPLPFLVSPFIAFSCTSCFLVLIIVNIKKILSCTHHH